MNRIDPATLLYLSRVGTLFLIRLYRYISRCEKFEVLIISIIVGTVVIVTVW
jgi:hypothetical protein